MEIQHPVPAKILRQQISMCQKTELDDLQKRRAEEFRQYQIRLLITDTNFSDLLGAAQTQSYNRLN